MTALTALADRWRADADRMIELGQNAPAALLRRAADELDAALQATEDEVLTLQEAVQASGYSARRLREMLAEGTIPNAGRKGVPRIRRADLPRKAKRTTHYDAATDARRVLLRASAR